MAHFLKVGELDELPPGKGKTLLVGGREVTIYNQEGRLVATSTLPRHLGGVVETTCEMPGRKFDTGIGDSPDRLRADELRYQVVVDESSVFILVEEGHVRPGVEPRLRGSRARRRR
jgi:nitrite reductase/ring-hydroxylating ferredoxin subunit